MRVALIFADAPHHKTAMVVERLARQPDLTLRLVTVPFVQRKPRAPLFVHRPDQTDAPSPAALAAGWPNVSHISVDAADAIPRDLADIFLMTGGVLIPDAFLAAGGGPVLNAHAGLIPQSRGLDAFKWAILEGLAVGNTLHEIDADVDLGQILTRRRTPVYSDDTLSRFAARHYQAEIDLLCDFASHLDSPRQPARTAGEMRPATMRMNAESEAGLPAAFERYKTRFAVSP